jgi:hypothetical protein
MLWTSWDERTDRGKTVYPSSGGAGYNKAPMTCDHAVIVTAGNFEP